MMAHQLRLVLAVNDNHLEARKNVFICNMFKFNTDSLTSMVDCVLPNPSVRNESLRTSY